MSMWRNGAWMNGWMDCGKCLQKEFQRGEYKARMEVGYTRYVLE